MFAWGARLPGRLRWWWVRRLAVVLLGGALVLVCGGVGYAVGWPGAPEPVARGAVPSGWGRPPPGLPGFGRLTARRFRPSGLPGLRRPLRCPHGLGLALPDQGPKSCEASVRAAACAPLRSVDVSGGTATVRTAENAPVLRRLTAMVHRSCGELAPRLPAPRLPALPRPDPPALRLPAPHGPPAASVPPRARASFPPVVKAAVPRPVAWPRHAPEGEVAAPAGLSTVGTLFLVLLPAVVAGAAAGARSVSRGR